MSNFLLINHIQVQDANAVAGFTWGFPAITHFLGFVHLLQRKINQNSNFQDIQLGGCMVITHSHSTRTYRTGSAIAFTQSRNPPYLDSHAKDSPPPIIEEGKMSMTVSLLIEVEGQLASYGKDFEDWVYKQSSMQRLAGGSILHIAGVTGFAITSERDKSLKQLQRTLLPGFVLINRSDLLSSHFKDLLADDSNAQLFDAWIDFIALKRRARPEHDLIDRHLNKLAKSKDDHHDNAYSTLLELWQQHLNKPYKLDNVPQELKTYFEQLSNESTDKTLKSLLNQWQQYYLPDERSKAQWEYEPKPSKGYLVPIMCGYKAISELLPNEDVAGTRDNETDVCFVEAVHSIGEWRSVHRFKDLTAIEDALWQYNYAPNWYLCSQKHDFDLPDGDFEDSFFIEPYDPNKT